METDIFRTFAGLVETNRSYRRFDPQRKVMDQELYALVALARNTPSSKNRQPLKYLLVHDENEVDLVFGQLKWAWFLRNWDGPSEHERPPAYIIMLLDKRLNDRADYDAGIAAQTMLLGASALGLGGCIVRTINRYALGKFFQLPEYMEIVLVLAIGKPSQQVVLDENDAKGNMEYWTDEEGVHHVPKRSVEELIYKHESDNDQD